jgi:hypothetical protein
MLKLIIYIIRYQLQSIGGSRTRTAMTNFSCISANFWFIEHAKITRRGITKSFLSIDT